MKERTISCSSLSKTYSITGWRLGYVISSEEITDRVRKTHDFLTVGAAAPLQETAVTALKFPLSYYDELAALYNRKRELFLDGLKTLGFDYSEPQGAYFVMADISNFGYKDDTEFCIDLAQKVGVGAVPGSSFFRESINNYIRFHYAKKEETLLEALNRLEDIKKLKR